MNFRAFDFYGSNNSTSSWTNKVKCFHEFLRDTQHGINKLTTICNLDGELKKVKKSKADFNQHLCMNSHKKLRSKEILILYLSQTHCHHCCQLLSWGERPQKFTWAAPYLSHKVLELVTEASHVSLWGFQESWTVNLKTRVLWFTQEQEWSTERFWPMLLRKFFTDPCKFEVSRIFLASFHIETKFLTVSG